MKEAMFYRKYTSGKNAVQCYLCARECIIADGFTGSCKVRKNIKGKLYSLNFGKIASVAIDNIEKKPLYHFYPGSQTLSIASMGCNFHCKFCQNFEISQPRQITGEEMNPEDVVALAKKYSLNSISYTYTEPTVFFEFAYETSKIASKQGIKNIFVTNGYITEKPLRKIKKYLHAANVDLKGFSDDFYRKLCLAPKLKPVLDTIKRMHAWGIHVEITTLLIPGWNTDAKQIKDIAKWIYSIDPYIPLHFSGYFPAYLLDVEPTQLKMIYDACRIAKKAGLKYVYAGNITDIEKSSTYCPSCGKCVIERDNINLISNKLLNGKCPYCGERILSNGCY